MASSKICLIFSLGGLGSCGLTVKLFATIFNSILLKNLRKIILN